MIVGYKISLTAYLNGDRIDVWYRADPLAGWIEVTEPVMRGSAVATPGRRRQGRVEIVTSGGDVMRTELR